MKISSNNKNMQIYAKESIKYKSLQLFFLFSYLIELDFPALLEINLISNTNKR